MAYTHKMVDGVEVPLTPEEIAECEAREAAWNADAPKRAAREQRNQEINNDTDRRDLLDKLQNATNQQVSQWVDNRIDPTTLAQLRDQTRYMFKIVLRALAQTAPTA